MPATTTNCYPFNYRYDLSEPGGPGKSRIGPYHPGDQPTPLLAVLPEKQQS